MSIVDIAKQAGAKEGETWCKGYYAFTSDQLEAFAELVRADERAKFGEPVAITKQNGLILKFGFDEMPENTNLYAKKG
jgi:hypothetical protein